VKLLEPSGRGPATEGGTVKCHELVFTICIAKDYKKGGVKLFGTNFTYLRPDARFGLQASLRKSMRLNSKARCSEVWAELDGVHPSSLLLIDFQKKRTIFRYFEKRNGY